MHALQLARQQLPAHQLWLLLESCDTMLADVYCAASATAAAWPLLLASQLMPVGTFVNAAICTGNMSSNLQILAVAARCTDKHVKFMAIARIPVVQRLPQLHALHLAHTSRIGAS